MANLLAAGVDWHRDAEEAGKVTSELTTESPDSDSASQPPPLDDTAARNHLLISLGFLALSVVGFGVAAIQLVLPDLLSGAGFLSYGRLLPAATNLFLFGWLTIGLFGAIYYILPRVTGTPLQFAPLASLSGVLLAVGYLAGSIAVALGASEGRRYLELPLWADAIVVLGLLGAIRAVTATIADRTDRELSPVEWYFGAAPIWLLLTTVVGNIPGVIGMNATIQTAFHQGALFGLWFAAAAVGVVYYLVPRLAGRSPQRPTQLSTIGFWSLGFVWALSGASALTYSAGPDWFETLGVVFAIALFLPVMVVFVDILGSMRERWAEVADRTVLRFVMAGAAMFAVIPVLNLLLAVRASNAVVGFTDWVSALEFISVFGAFTFWLMAFLYHAFGGAGAGSGAWHFRLSVTGAGVAVGAMMVAGLAAGLTWVGAANAGEIAAGEGFRSSSDGLLGVYWVRTAGIALFVLAQAWFAIRFLGRVRSASGAVAETPLDEEEGDEPLPGVGLNRLRLGTVGLFAVAVLFGFVFPTTESSHLTNSLLADEARFYEFDAERALGRDLYLSEGCWYCHTQEVRQIVTDVGLGAVSLAEDYAWEVPPARGVLRLGPDLFHVGSRELTGSPLFVQEHLADPRSQRPWSLMPSYDYLSDAELRALASYLVNLK